MSDDTKTCPFCAEEIKTAAIKCKHCGSALVPAEGEKKPAAEVPGADTPATSILEGPVSKKPLGIVAGIGGGLLLAAMVVVYFSDSCQGMFASRPGGSPSVAGAAHAVPPINVIGAGVATLADWKHDGAPSHLKAKLCVKPGASVEKVEYVVYSGSTVLKEDAMGFPAVSAGSCVKATLWWDASDKPTRIGIVVRGKLAPRKGPLPRICQAIVDCCDNTLRYFHSLKSKLSDACRGHFLLLCNSAWKSSAATGAECSRYIGGFAKDCGKWIPASAPECRGAVASRGTGAATRAALGPPDGREAPTLAGLKDLTLTETGALDDAKRLVRSGVARRKVSRYLNGRGLAWYKMHKRPSREANLKHAATAFESAYKIDPRYEAPIYNRACVAGLLKDAAIAVKWLKALKGLGTARARKQLAKVRTDKDFDSVRQATTFSSFISAVTQ